MATPCRAPRCGAPHRPRLAPSARPTCPARPARLARPARPARAAARRPRPVCLAGSGSSHGPRAG
ncbi:hypothetical protein FVW27_11175 [Desulfovibrio sp. XJ01]|nr:hypothetical protein [Nitratidesulfovibrio liaohensis]